MQLTFMIFLFSCNGEADVVIATMKRRLVTYYDPS